jgi:hypothetical protein
MAGEAAWNAQSTQQAQEVPTPPVLVPIGRALIL